MEKNNNSKKMIIILIVVISLLSIGGLLYASIALNSEKKDADKYLKEIDYKELKEKVDKKESFILVVTRTDCSHCEAFKPKLKEVLKSNKIIAYEIPTDKLSEDDAKEFKKDYNVLGTPTTIFLKNGEETTVSNRLIGDVSKSKIKERLKSLNYIKE